jgi:ubiquinone/menaquinone biosynthesis C-methylase UbiE
MCNEYLATGFANVDDRDDTTVYKHCLALLDSLPYFRKYKQRSYELLTLSTGLSVLEVGSGLGDDALRMAGRLGPDGIVVGVDASARMIEEAVDRTPAEVRVEFVQADARDLPFREESFARCRVDRTLQHIEGPQQAIREMVRVLKPSGLLLAYDNDWGTFSVSGSNGEFTRIIETLWEDSFTNRWVGRYLKHYFLEAGLQNVVIEPSVSVVTDFEVADRVYSLRQTVERAVEAGCLIPAVAAEWVSGLQALSQSDGFLCTLTAYTVVGMKPA